MSVFYDEYDKLYHVNGSSNYSAINNGGSSDLDRALDHQHMGSSDCECKEKKWINRKGIDNCAHYMFIPSENPRFF